MRKMLRVIFILTIILSFGIIHSQAQIDSGNIFPDDEDVLASAALLNTDGEVIGGVLIAGFDEDDMQDVLGIWVVVWNGLEPGFHAFHIHSIGTCEQDSDAPFVMAGGHFNLDNATHGEHAGDLPSLYATASGGSALIFLTDAFTLVDLMDGDGSAFIIHAGRDNYSNIPEHYGQADEATLNTGDAGSRVVCGIVELGVSSELGD